MKTYPVEYRRRVIELRAQNWSSVRIADALGLSRAWVDSIRRLHAAGQPLEPKSRANHRTSLAQRQGERLKAQVAAKPGPPWPTSNGASAFPNRSGPSGWP